MAKTPQRAAARDWAEYVVPQKGYGIELLRAHFSGHAYERHSHEGYALGVTEAGTQAFNCRGAHHVSTERMVIAINPDEAHDGHAGDAGGFTYRMLYLAPETVRRVMEDRGDGRAAALPYASAPLIADPGLGRLIAALHGALASAAPRLECEALIDATLLRFSERHAECCASAPRPPRPSDGALSRVRDYLEGTALAEDVSADELARLAGMSRFHLCSTFRRRYGLPPHAYRLRLRLAAAKRMLAAGEPPAAVAASLGFADQSHLHKRFKGAFGVTPGQFAAAARSRSG